MQPLTALLLLALAAFAGAETGGIMLGCPGPGWSIYRDRYETSCLRLMTEPKLFGDAFKACHAVQSRLLSLLHKRSKILFVNDLILNSAGQNHTLWFFDPLDTHQELVKEHPPPPPPQDHNGQNARWLVINPNSDESRIELVVNMTAVPRSFICEAPARPAAQRAQLEREPEDVLISEELLKAPADKDAKRPPFIVTFNCQAYGIPKPTVRWVLTGDAGDAKALTVESINATVLNDPRLPLRDAESGAVFFNLQRDCHSQPCPSDNIQERSQLIVVNPQLLDLKKRIACVASNDFGSVLSREAQVFVAKLGAFANQTESVPVKSGLPAIVPNQISADPDAASAECFRVLKTAEGPAKLIPVVEMNRATRGGIQMSKATFELIIDAAAPEDSGQYMCQARVHNGRLGHVTRERTFTLDVKPCVKTTDAACDLFAKPVTVVRGYPTALSMNILSNRVIRAGDDFLLECPCTGKRHPEEELHVSWNLNNVTDMTVVPIPLLPKNSALLIRGASSQVHTGFYHCRCHRGADTSAWSILRVDVLPAPAPIEHRDLVSAKPGQTASLDCRIPVLDGATVTVQPLRGVKPLTEAVAAADSKRFKVTRTGANQFSLAIASVTEADSDVYGCRVLANYLGKWVDYNTYYTTLVVDKSRR